MQRDVVEKMFSVQLATEQEATQMQVQQAQQRPRRIVMSHGEQVDAADATLKREGPKVGRNDPCPCGSGKKYKRCHGK
jgi:preprotein translocase subunit SecA